MQFIQSMILFDFDFECIFLNVLGQEKKQSPRQTEKMNAIINECIFCTIVSFLSLVFHFYIWLSYCYLLFVIFIIIIIKCFYCCIFLYPFLSRQLWTWLSRTFRSSYASAHSGHIYFGSSLLSSMLSLNTVDVRLDAAVSL